MLMTKSGTRLIGFLLLIFSLLFNPMILGYLFANDRTIDPIITKIAIISFEIIIFLIAISILYRPVFFIKRRKEIFIFIIVFIISLFLAEGIIAFVDYKFNNRCIEYDDKLGWDIKPNCEAMLNEEEFHTIIKTNNFGMRESENFELENEKYRIAFVGDSFVWGYGVNEEERFTNIVQKRLGEEYEVMNFGVPGFSTDQYLLKIKEDVLKFNPDMIIVSFVLNDLTYIDEKVAYGKNKPLLVFNGDDLKIENYPIPKSSWKPKIIIKINELLTGINKKLFLKEEFPEIFKLNGKDYDEEIKLNNNVYKEIKSIADKNDIDMAIIYIPQKTVFISEEELKGFGLSFGEVYLNRPAEIVQNLSNELDVAYIDLQPYLGVNGGSKNYFIKDTHFNQVGHINSAMVISNELLQILK